jgi:hypothetical protein
MTIPPHVETTFRQMADRALDRAEGGAQLEIKDTVLREALMTTITDEIRAAYKWASDE